MTSSSSVVDGSSLAIPSAPSLPQPKRPWWLRLPSRANCPGCLPHTASRSEVEADRLRVHGTNRHHVAQVAFDHRIRLDELTEVSATLEDILLDLTATTAEFAAA